MRFLFIGGTGNISTACTQLAVTRGHEVWLLNRGKRAASISGAQVITADAKDLASARAALGDRHWDAVVNFIAFKPEDIERDLELFRGRTGQYVFISSASCYQRPVRHYLITESTPLVNPLWQYSRDKIACEDRLTRALRDEGFPSTVVRPSHTYSDTQITLPINSWEKSFTVVDRMRRGLPVIIPGDGTSLWTLTHNTDFAKGLVGLLGNPQAIGHAFHITSDEVQTWNQYYAALAQAAGVASPRFVHIASDFLIACAPELQGTLLGDKATSVVLDNSKIKRFVPGFTATMSFHEGIAKTIAWFDAEPARKVIDDAANARWDKIIAGYERGMAETKRSLAET
jgi:nucleoside-diphosphate-sugar epimerase